MNSCNRENIRKAMTLCAGSMMLLLLFVLSSTADAAASGVLYDWNEGSGTLWPGWTWSDDVAYGHPGWIMDDGNAYRWGDGPRSFEKSDYGTDALAIIDSNARAPGTTTGGSFKVYDTGNDSAYQACWWVWYDGQPMANWGLADENTNRWSFYLKTKGTAPITDDGGNESIPSSTYHIGTYVCWNDGRPVTHQGDGCPYEGPGNQHYYHYLSINSGAWIKVLLDRHPQHRRGSYVIGDDPTFLESGYHYLEHLNQFYMEIRIPQAGPTAFWVDEMKFYSTTDTAVPNQNDESITSLWVGYWPQQDHWEMGWHDMSWATRDNDTQSTFDIRWSTAPITNGNFSAANQTTPLLYSGPEYSGDIHLVRRPNAWGSVVWTRFKLPDDVETDNNRIYLAVKDVSVTGEHVGSTWPWNRGDGHNAPSPYIHTIDYDLGKSPARHKMPPAIAPRLLLTK